ncbi:endo-1,3(4)-beta-glucanase xgeA [Aspergillus spinulosporus]
MSSSFMRRVGSLAASAIIFPGITHAAGSYKLKESWEGEKILNHFHFFDNADPTNGFVTYVNQSYAESAGLVKTTDSGSLYLGVDYETVLTVDGPGRESVRIESNEYYDQGLYVVDIQHMPGSICGTWPAFWTVGPDWPTDGEIDIIEGVNKHEANKIVLHTSDTCDVGGGYEMTGNMTSSECGEPSGTIGCVVQGQQGSSGDPFNEQGGGVYAMEWQEKYLKIWYFPRSSIPESLTAGTPDVSSFGTPMAHLQGSCNFKERFTHQKLILDTTFCGDWAGGVFGDSGCPVSDPSDPMLSCKNYVAENPAVYKNAYWELNSIKIYQIGETAEVEGTQSAAAETTAAETTAAATQTTNGGSIEEITTSTHSVTRTKTVSATHSIETAAATTAAASVASEVDATNTQPVSKTKSTSYVTSTTTLCPVESSQAAATGSVSKTKTTSYVTITTTLCPVESLQTANAVPSAEASTDAAAATTPAAESHPSNAVAPADSESSADAVAAQTTETAVATNTPNPATDSSASSIPPDSIVYTAPGETSSSSVPLFTIISSSSQFVTVPTAAPSSFEPTDAVRGGADSYSTAASPTTPSSPVFTGVGSKVSISASVAIGAFAMLLLVN